VSILYQPFYNLYDLIAGRNSEQNEDILYSPRQNPAVWIISRKNVPGIFIKKDFFIG
jgi:hypothetical protein